MSLNLGSITPESDSKQLLTKKDKFENSILKKSFETNSASNLILKMPNNPLDNGIKINKNTEILSNSNSNKMLNCDNNIFSSTQKKGFNLGLNLRKNNKADINEGPHTNRNEYINSHISPADTFLYNDVKYNGAKNFNQTNKIESNELIDPSKSTSKKMFLSSVNNNFKNQTFQNNDKRNRIDNRPQSDSLLTSNKLESYTKKFGQIIQKHDKI